MRGTCDAWQNAQQISERSGRTVDRQKILTVAACHETQQRQLKNHAVSENAGGFLILEISADFVGGVAETGIFDGGAVAAAGCKYRAEIFPLHVPHQRVVVIFERRHRPI